MPAPVLIVTGVSRGIGRAIAEELQSRGAAGQLRALDGGYLAPGLPTGVGRCRCSVKKKGIVSCQKNLQGQVAVVTGASKGIAPAVVVLASPDSAWTTGETLYISGGLR